MLNTLSEIGTTAIAPMTSEELAAVEGGFGWLVVLGVGAYIHILKEAWELGEKIGDTFWG